MLLLLRRELMELFDKNIANFYREWKLFIHAQMALIIAK